MGWNYKTLSGYDDPPDWLVELRAEQREQIRALRRGRAAHGRKIFAEYVRRSLDGLGPWRFANVFDRWREIADIELVNNQSPKGRIGGQPLRGFGRRWAIGQLRAIGYTVSGNWHKADGVIVDSRIIHAPTPTVLI